MLTDDATERLITDLLRGGEDSRQALTHLFADVYERLRALEGDAEPDPSNRSGIRRMTPEPRYGI